MCNVISLYVSCVCVSMCHNIYVSLPMPASMSMSCHHASLSLSISYWWRWVVIPFPLPSFTYLPLPIYLPLFHCHDSNLLHCAVFLCPSQGIQGKPVLAASGVVLLTWSLCDCSPSQAAPHIAQGYCCLVYGHDSAPTPVGRFLFLFGWL